MKKITIFALNHRVVKVNAEAIKMDVVDPSSPLSYETAAHGGCSILVDKILDKKLKKELENLQIDLKKQNGFGTILACVNEVQK